MLRSRIFRAGGKLARTLATHYQRLGEVIDRSGEEFQRAATYYRGTDQAAAERIDRSITEATPRPTGRGAQVHPE